MFVKPASISILSRFLSIYGILLFLASWLVYHFLFNTEEDSDILAITILCIIIFNAIIVLLTRRMNRIAISVNFDDIAQQASIRYYEFGFFSRTVTVPYSSLYFGVVPRGLLLKASPHGVQLYDHKKLILHIKEGLYSWDIEHMNNMVLKLNSISKLIAPSQKTFLQNFLQYKMNRIFSLEPVYYKKMQLAVYIVMMPAMIFMFLYIVEGGHDIIPVMLSIIGLFCTLLVVFYLNRYEITTLAVTDNEFSIQYFNKSIFRKKPFKGNKSMVSTIIENDTIQLFHNSKYLALIRKPSVTEKEWQEIRAYFQVS